MYAHVRPSKSDDSAQYCAMSDIKHVLCLPPLSFSRAGAFFFFFFCSSHYVLNALHGSLISMNN